MRPFLIALALLSSLLSFSWNSNSSSNKEGCIIDPNGLHTAGGSGSGEEGCILDPSGLCASAVPALGEAGCILDPDGRCGG